METDVQWRRGLSTRLKHLADQHGQAPIARKTGTSRQNVNRYLSGRRVPLEFGAKLVQGLGVNPAWLMVGEGKPLLSDVSEETASTASDMLEMVRAMEAVSRRRLGELAGKEYAKTLRELNDTLQSFERQRERLEQQTRPWLEKLTKELFDEVGDGRLSHARQLREACAQLARFTSNDDLLINFNEAEAYLLHRLGQNEAAQQLQQHVFMRRMVTMDPRNPLWGRSAHNAIVGLVALGKLRRARRVCHAALAIMEDGAADAESYHRLLGMAGTVDLDLGDLSRGLDRLTRASAGTAHTRYPIAQSLFDYAQLLSGANELPRCLRQYRKGDHIHRRILYFASFVEDATTLAATGELIFSRSDEADAGEDPFTLHGKRLLNAMTGKKPPSALPPRPGPYHNFIACAHEAQIARVMGQAKAARELTQRAAQELAKIPEEQTAPLMTRAIHCRNALKLLEKDDTSAKAARAFLSEYAAKGYRCFEPLLV